MGLFTPPACAAQAIELLERNLAEAKKTLQEGGEGDRGGGRGGGVERGGLLSLASDVPSLTRPQELHEDQALLRDQITTTEVNMARVFNWDVKERRKAKAAEASEAQ